MMLIKNVSPIDKAILLKMIPDSKIHGANMGLIWGRQGPDGPHVGPINLAIRDDLSFPGSDESKQQISHNKCKFIFHNESWVFGTIWFHVSIVYYYWFWGCVETMYYANTDQYLTDQWEQIFNRILQTYQCLAESIWTDHSKDTAYMMSSISKWRFHGMYCMITNISHHQMLTLPWLTTAFTIKSYTGYLNHIDSWIWKPLMDYISPMTHSQVELWMTSASRDHTVYAPSQWEMVLHCVTPSLIGWVHTQNDAWYPN